MTRVTTRYKNPHWREVWMQLRDRKVLAKLMTIQGVTSRQLAEAAGWKAHSYVNRLLRGEVNTLRTEPAIRIAKYLGVGTDDLFLTQVDRNAGCSSPKSSDKGKRSGRRPRSGSAA